MSALQTALKVYQYFVGKAQNGKIPISLRHRKLVGTVQDDPFDHWVEEQIAAALPSFEITHAGALTTPDLIVRDRKSGEAVGFEVKKLIQMFNGTDPRGLTLDYNSSIPCGSALIRVGQETVTIPCFYIFALLSPQSDSIVTLLLMDGDFLNYDFNLHKKAKFDNVSEYGHGPYGEGSVRHRKMYTYPNPLNHKLPFFHLRQVLVCKKPDWETSGKSVGPTEIIVRSDIYSNDFYYLILDATAAPRRPAELQDLPVFRDVFKPCKERKEKERTASMVNLPPLNDEQKSN